MLAKFPKNFSLNMKDLYERSFCKMSHHDLSQKKFGDMFSCAWSCKKCPVRDTYNGLEGVMKMDICHDECSISTPYRTTFQKIFMFGT